MSQLEGNKLAFIGGGNMAYAIISGLVSQGLSKESIIVSEPWEVNRNKVADLGVPTTTDNLEAAGDADIVIIAVKPQVCKSVCEEMRSVWGHRQSLPIILSIAAGITLGSLKNWTKTEDGKTAPTVRAMPNTPALVGEGAVGLFASDDVTEEHKKRLDTLLRSIAKAVEWVNKEELLDVVTGLSGKSLNTTVPTSTN
jgi:pyrroline-5-carboxylate reductase